MWVGSRGRGAELMGWAQQWPGLELPGAGRKLSTPAGLGNPHLMFILVPYGNFRGCLCL